MKNKIVIVLILLLIGFNLVNIILENKKNFDINEESFVYIESYLEDEYLNGSGIVYKSIDSINYILTSYHLVYDSNDIYVYDINNKRNKADIVFFDKKYDIALISINNNLKSAKRCDSDKIKLGDFIYVYGTPLKKEYINSLTSGIVSNVNRNLKTNNDYGISEYNAIQIDAKVNYGNSGGALLDSSGCVIGIISVMEENIPGIGFAIPINSVIDVLKSNNFLRY